MLSPRRCLEGESAQGGRNTEAVTEKQQHREGYHRECFTNPLRIFKYQLMFIKNFNVYKDMSPSVSKNTVAFVGREGGAPASYRLRVKTAEHANDLKKAIDKEIEFVKAKASDAQ